MKYCTHCGREILDEAVICPGCGCAVESTTKMPQESSNTANSAILLAILFPIIGLVLGIVGTCNYKTPKYKTRCIIAIPLSIFAWIVWIGVLAFLGTGLALH